MIVAPGWSLEDVAGENDQQLVAPEDAPLAVHDADAVGVAVQADAQVGAGLLHLGDQVLQVLDHGGVGMVVGEAPVHVADRVRMTSAPSRRYSSGAVMPPVPLPPSTTTRIFFFKRDVILDIGQVFGQDVFFR